MSSSGFKKQLFEQFARVGKAVGSAHRLEILEAMQKYPDDIPDMDVITFEVTLKNHHGSIMHRPVNKIIHQ